MQITENTIRVATSDAQMIHAGVADDVIDFVKTIREDFTHEVHYLGPSVLVEMVFQEDVSKLAVLIKLVFGGVEVALV